MIRCMLGAHFDFGCFYSSFICVCDNDGERLLLCSILIEQDKFYNKLTSKCIVTQYNYSFLAYITADEWVGKWLISTKAFRDSRDVQPSSACIF